MMRSAPAASAHLAEIPVPAPAPRMGTPTALLARHRFTHADRSIMPFLQLVKLDATIRLLDANFHAAAREPCREGCRRSAEAGSLSRLRRSRWAGPGAAQFR